MMSLKTRTKPGQLALDLAHARRTDPETSRAAAKSITSEKIRASQEAVLGLLRNWGPLDDTSLVALYQKRPLLPPQSESGIRTRRSELVAKGLAQDTGERTVLASGRRAILWAAA